VRRASSTVLAALLAAAALSIVPGAANAAGPPQVSAVTVEAVTASSAVLRGQANPNGLSTTFRFEYLTEAAYQANLSAEPSSDGFKGAATSPTSGSGVVGSGSNTIPVVPQQLSKLASNTTYRYRLVVKNSAGEDQSVVSAFATQAPTNAFVLLDNRAWELVSPVDKGGGSIPPPAALFGGGDFQASSSGEQLTFSSPFSFAGGIGAPPLSQYLATRSASGWSTQNISPSLLSGSYGDHPDGAPYRLFSTDLSRALLSNGERCRGEAGGNCPVANPPLPGSGAPAGFRDYYLRSGSSFGSLLSASALDNTERTSSEFELALAGATPDLSHVVLSSCAALTADAVEEDPSADCATAPRNLYEFSGLGLKALNFLPGQTTTSPGAELPAQNGAISADGSRVYFTELEGGGIYLRDGNTTKLLPETAGGGASFQAASTDGAFAYFTAGSRLFRYSAQAQTSTDLTPSGGVTGVLGSSADASFIYYATTTGVFLWNAGATSEVASGPILAANYLPATGTARVSADGTHLLFSSAVSLTGYPNAGNAELYLYGPLSSGGAPRLICVSCKSTGETAGGSASVPGATPNGTTEIYKPRVLSENGRRVFFESDDKLSIQDTNNRRDVYEWEALGEGNCAIDPGCVQLVSAGRSPQPSTFIDASSDGSSAFFLTDESLVTTDPGSTDVYVARSGGGFPPPPSGISCDGDACQVLPGAPDDPTPGTQVSGPANPPVHFPKSHKKPRKPKHKSKKHKNTHKKWGRAR
jgi:hypothetical protein